MDCPAFTGSDERDWPSVADHHAESHFRTAAEHGADAVDWLTRADLTDHVVAMAVQQAEIAAWWYHEGLRASGIDPETGLPAGRQEDVA